MRTAALLLLLGPACTAAPAKSECVATPIMTLSDTLVDFGEVPLGERATERVTLSNTGARGTWSAVADLGIGSHVGGFTGIDALDAGDGAFAVAWDPAEVSCTSTNARNAWDSGWPGPDTAGAETDTGPAASPAPVLLLPAGCSVPLTVSFAGDRNRESWGVVRVESIDELDLPDGTAPAYARDPRNYIQEVFLHASRPPVPEIDASPRAVDFGSPAADGTRVDAELTLSNLGDAELTVAGVALDNACSPDFSIVNPVSPGTALVPGASTGLTVGFAATAESFLDCRLRVESDDPVRPELTVVLYAWAGEDTGDLTVDDDHDGYTELEGDCDDSNLDLHPGATEECNGIDDDCNGLKDSADGCEDDDPGPEVIGGLGLLPDACQEGETVAVTLLLDAPADDVRGESLNGTVIALAAGPNDLGTWECRQVASCAEAYTLYATVTDAAERQDWGGAKVVAWKAEDGPPEFVCPAGDEECP